VGSRAGLNDRGKGKFFTSSGVEPRPLGRPSRSQSKSKSKVVPVTGREGLKGCEMLRIRHCLDNRLIDGGKVVILTHQPHFTPQKHYYFNASGTNFC
jgi:hypothetical protein